MAAKICQEILTIIGFKQHIVNYIINCITEIWIYFSIATAFPNRKDKKIF